MVITVSADTFEEKVLGSTDPVIVEFWHEECPHCRRFNPVFKEVSREFSEITFAQLNIGESRENFEIAKEYGIMGTPTLKFFCDGKVFGELVGYRSKEQFMNEIRNMVKENTIQSCLEESSALEDFDVLYT